MNSVVTGPLVHKNLAVYLVHGEDKLKGREFLTLQEALVGKQAHIFETGAVNELMVENLSKDQEIFIQAGEIVRGGKQDRVVGVDLIIAARSGKIPLKSFCVEQGRWSRRGSESVAEFSASPKLAYSKKMKLAINSKADQREVWNEVAESQRRLSANLAGEVASPASPSSLQLSLENKDLEKETREYTRALSDAVTKDEDVVGIVIAINGRLDSADVYSSPKLFRKLWPKLVEAAATGAVASQKDKKETAQPTIEDVQAFMTNQEGKASTTEVSKRIRMVTRESDKTASFEIYDAAAPAVQIHTSHVRKEK